MLRIYECPNCRAIVSPGESYCGYCGFQLKQLQDDRMTPPASLPSYTYHDTATPADNGGGWPTYQQPTQVKAVVKTGNGEPDPVRIAATRELHSNILKLLDDMLSKQKSN